MFTIVCPDSVIADPPSCWRAGLPVEMVCRQVKLMLRIDTGGCSVNWGTPRFRWLYNYTIQLTFYFIMILDLN